MLWSKWMVHEKWSFWRCQDLIPGPLGHESSALTTRPRRLAFAMGILIFQVELNFNINFARVNHLTLVSAPALSIVEQFWWNNFPEIWPPPLLNDHPKRLYLKFASVESGNWKSWVLNSAWVIETLVCWALS